MKGRKIAKVVLEDPEVHELRQVLREIDRIEHEPGHRGRAQDRIDRLQLRSVRLQRSIQERGLNMTHVNAVVTSIWDE